MGDSDGDGVADNVDNCVDTANPNQVDVDGDGIGNYCDADPNNDGIVDAVDYGIFGVYYGSTDPLADFDSSGSVNVTDWIMFAQMYNDPSGPAGAGSVTTAACTAAEGNCP